MDHDLIVEQLLARCTGLIETIVQAADLHRVATASLAIFAPVRDVAREMLQAKITLEGVMAPSDGRWQDAQGGTILVRRLAVQAEKPTLGAILARRYVGILGSAEDLAIRLTQVIREAGWEPIPLGEIVGDGAPWIWTVAEAHVPGVRQPLDF